MRRAMLMLVVLTVLALVVTLAGCSGGNGAPDGATMDAAKKPPPQPPPPPPDPTECKIVFNLETGHARKRALHIFTINTDGTDLQQLTDGPGMNYDPAWSPDGQWLCYSYAPVLGSATRELYRMPSDGGEVEQLTSLGGRNEWPAWSPDGARIAFSHAGAIAVLDLNSMVVTDLTELGWSGYAMDYSPKWSPDGATIIFGARVGPNATYETLHTVPSTTQGAPHDPVPVVPGGRWVDWCHVEDGGQSQITYTIAYGLYIATVDSAGVLVAGSEQQIAVPTRATMPAWAPDGSAIVYNSLDDDSLYIVDPAGEEDVQQLCAAGWYPPDWSPPVFGNE